MYYDVNLEIDYKAVGERIRAARVKKGLKQHNLAALAEISPTNVSHIERGKAKLSLPTLMKLTPVTGLEPVASDSQSCALASRI